MIQFRQQGGYAMLSYEEFSDIYDNASDEVKVEIEEILNMLQARSACLEKDSCISQTILASLH